MYLTLVFWYPLPLVFYHILDLLTYANDHVVKNSLEYQMLSGTTTNAWAIGISLVVSWYIGEPFQLRHHLTFLVLFFQPFSYLHILENPHGCQQPTLSPNVLLAPLGSPTVSTVNSRQLRESEQRSSLRTSWPLAFSRVIDHNPAYFNSLLFSPANFWKHFFHTIQFIAISTDILQLPGFLFMGLFIQTGMRLYQRY